MNAIMQNLLAHRMKGSPALGGSVKPIPPGGAHNLIPLPGFNRGDMSSYAPPPPPPRMGGGVPAWAQGLGNGPRPMVGQQWPQILQNLGHPGMGPGPNYGAPGPPNAPGVQGLVPSSNFSGDARRQAITALLAQMRGRAPGQNPSPRNRRADILKLLRAYNRPQGGGFGILTGMQRGSLDPTTKAALDYLAMHQGMAGGRRKPVM